MKNTFKYIATFVALVSGLAVYAQNPETDTYYEENGIAYVKTAVLNDDGTYTIDLQTFVTGKVTVVTEAVPVDVVLVLDVSGSMTDPITNYSYTVASVSSITGDGVGLILNNPSSTGYYIEYQGSYYEVYRGRAHQGGLIFGTDYYYLQFTANGTTYYINTNGQVVTTRPSNVTNEDTNLLSSNVTLYTQNVQETTKIAALRTAVDAFINEIQKNDLFEEDGVTPRQGGALGNRIAIVKFAMDDYYNSNADYDDDTAPWNQPGNHLDGSGYNYTEVIRGFTSTSSQSSVDDLMDAVNRLNPAGATAADYGMNLARLLIKNIPADRTSNKTVVFFTDGAPTYGNTFNNTVANRAVVNAHDVKQITYGTGEDATHPSVFSVGLFDSNTSTDEGVNRFMNRVSSNFPNASGMGTNPDQGGTQASTDYYFNASGGSVDNLKSIFTAIAHSAGGSGNTEVTGQSTLTVDIVSSSFSVPTGFQDASDAVTVLVAPCNSVTTIGDKEYLLFGEAKAPSEYGLPAITPSISEADNKVSTTGFDYSENWCGPYPGSTSAVHNYAYHGYKQIIRFVITIKDDAVGGPDVETNNPNSGIYLPGATEPVVKFNRPTVKVPVQIWIQKIGLQDGDNAVFTLARTPFVENFDPATAEWEEDWGTKIVIGPEDYDHETGMYLKKQIGLNPEYYYRIKEDAWAFGYTYQLGGVQ